MIMKEDADDGDDDDDGGDNGDHHEVRRIGTGVVMMMRRAGQR